MKKDHRLLFTDLLPKPDKPSYGRIWSTFGLVVLIMFLYMLAAYQDNQAIAKAEEADRRVSMLKLQTCLANQDEQP